MTTLVFFAAEPLLNAGCSGSLVVKHVSGIGQKMKSLLFIVFIDNVPVGVGLKSGTVVVVGNMPTTHVPRTHAPMIAM